MSVWTEYSQSWVSSQSGQTSHHLTERQPAEVWKVMKDIIMVRSDLKGSDCKLEGSHGLVYICFKILNMLLLNYNRTESHICWYALHSIAYCNNDWSKLFHLNAVPLLCVFLEYNKSLRYTKMTKTKTSAQIKFYSRALLRPTVSIVSVPQYISWFRDSHICVHFLLWTKLS